LAAFVEVPRDFPARATVFCGSPVEPSKSNDLKEMSASRRRRFLDVLELLGEPATVSTNASSLFSPQSLVHRCRRDSVWTCSSGVGASNGSWRSRADGLRLRAELVGDVLQRGDDLVAFDAALGESQLQVELRWGLVAEDVRL